MEEGGNSGADDRATTRFSQTPLAMMKSSGEIQLYINVPTCMCVYIVCCIYMDIDIDI